MDLPPQPQPVCDLDLELVEYVVDKSWPITADRLVRGPNNVKAVFNSAFHTLNNELIQILRSIDPNGCIVEGYKQLELWTILYHHAHDGTDNAGIEGPVELAPAARYGWRYVIEKSLELTDNDQYIKIRPANSEIATIFTILICMNWCSEWSDFLHFFPDDLSSVFITKHPPFLLSSPNLSGLEDKAFFEKRQYIALRVPPNKYEQFNPTLDDLELKNLINRFLRSNFGFELSHIIQFTEFLAVEICKHISITVHSFEYVSSWLSDGTKNDKSVVKSFLNFILLSPVKIRKEKRNYLSKSQQARMINYCGLRLPNVRNLEAIYDSEAARRDYILNDKQHIILSPFMLGEWLDSLKYRLTHGQRSDLRTTSKKNKQLADIEDYYRCQIFEGELFKAIESIGYIGFLNLIKYTKSGKAERIPCGEIDIIAYNKTLKMLLLLEAKAHAGLIDSRSIHQCYQDHFTQKKYHQKFSEKIKWVKGNMNTIKDMFLTTYCDIDLFDVKQFKPIFITKYPSIVKYYVTDYDVMTYFEFLDTIKTNQANSADAKSRAAD